MELYEKKPCTRCGGSGHYSYNQIDGTKCFGCSGSGQMLTTRDKAVKKWLDTRLAVKAADVKIGDRVTFDDYVARKRIRYTVKRIVETKCIEGSYLRNGVMRPFQNMQVKFTSASGRTFIYQKRGTVRLLPNDEIIAEAVAHRETLTKAGKPRKR